MDPDIQDVAQRTGELLRNFAGEEIQEPISSAYFDLGKKMVKVEDRYTKQFSNMNKIMDEMNAMQDYLEQQLSNLPYNNKD